VCVWDNKRIFLATRDIFGISGFLGWKEENFGARKNAIGYSLVSRREILAYAEAI